MRLVLPSQEYLPSYVAALERGWSPNNERGIAAAFEELENIRSDPRAFLDSMDDREAKGLPVTMPDGSVVPRLPGFRRWLWDGEFAGSIGLRWQVGTAELPPYCLGHIGYGVVPWRQRRGYATAALVDMLGEARLLGLPHVDITTDPENIASQKVILAAGGRLLRKVHEAAAVWQQAMPSVSCRPRVKPPKRILESTHMKSALLIIDVQHALCTGEEAAFDIGRVIERINALGSRARAAGAPVILIQHEEDGGPLQFGTDGWQLAGDLATSPGDLRVRKRAPDSFHQTELHALLQEREVTSLVVCGLQSDFCIDSTVRRALALGYHVVLVADGHSTVDNGVLSAAQISAHHNVTLGNMKSFGPSVTAVDAGEVDIENGRFS